MTDSIGFFFMMLGIAILFYFPEILDAFKGCN
jgi:hypothetical protein